MDDIVHRETVALLLTERQFVERLARQLVGDRPLADDVAQNVWAAAIAAPPSRLTSVRGWLARVTRNAALQVVRSERRREAREQRTHTERPAEPGAAETVERAETGRGIAEAVLALREPYRSTLLLRYREELTPAEAAERLGVPVETVRTRTRRALALLRTSLDAQHGGGDRTWRHALLPLIALHPSGVSRPLARPIAAAAATETVGRGALLMASTWKIVVAGAVGLALLAVLLPSDDGDEVEISRAGVVLDDDPASTRRRAPSPDAADPISAAPSATDVVAGDADTIGDESGPPPPRLVLRIVDALAETTEATTQRYRISLAEWRPPGLHARPLLATSVTKSTSTLELPLHVDGADVGEIRLTVSSPVHVPTTVPVAWDARHAPNAPGAELDVVLVPAGILIGDVVRPDEAAVRVIAYAVVGGRIEAAPVDATWTDAEGTYRLRVAPDQTHIVLAIPHDRALQPAAVRGTAPAGTERTLSTMSLAASVELRGRLTVDHGMPIDERNVAASPISDAGQPFRVAGAQMRHEGQRLRARAEELLITDDLVLRTGLRGDVARDGTFTIDGLSPVPHRVAAGERAPTPHGLLFIIPDRIHATADLIAERAQEWRPGDPDVALDLQGALLDVLATREGLPLEGAEAKTWGAMTRDGDLITQVMPRKPGSFLLGARPDTEYAVKIWIEGSEPKDIVVRTGPPGSRTEAHADFSRRPPATASFAVVLRRADGSLLRHAHVSVQPILAPRDSGEIEIRVGEDGRSGKVAADDGRLVFDDLVPGRSSVTIYPEASTPMHPERYLAIHDEIDLRDGAVTEQTYDVRLGGRLEIAARNAEGALIRANCEIHDPSGTSIDPSFVTRTPDSASYGPSLQGTGPSLVIRVLEPGTYRVRVWTDELGSREVDAVVEADRTVHVEVQLDDR